MMRAVVIALFILCVQFMGLLVAESGIYDATIYAENTLTDFEVQDSPMQTEAEQIQASISGLGDIFDLLTWGWIKSFFQPWYSTHAKVTHLIDLLLFGLRSVTGLIVAAAIVEIVRNNTNLLGSK